MRRAAHRIPVLLCFLAGLSLGLFGTFSISPAEPGQTGMVGVVSMLGATEHLGKSLARYRVAFVGDSTTMAYGEERKVPDRLQQRLKASVRASSPLQVFNLGTPGLGTHDYYFAAGEIARNEPSVLVIALNLACFSDAFIQRFKRPAFAALLSPSQVPEAVGLPIQDIGLTADRVLLYVGLSARESIFEIWRWLSRNQSAVQGSHQALAYRLDDAMGHAATASLDKALRWELMAQNNQLENRYDAVTTRNFFGIALDGRVGESDALVMLRAAVQALTDRGVPTLVYVGPVNREHMMEIGVWNEAGLKQSIQAIRQAMRDAGGELLDLHDILPDAGFRDGAGHYTVRGVDGPALVADALAPAVAAVLEVQTNGD